MRIKRDKASRRALLPFFCMAALVCVSLCLGAFWGGRGGMRREAENGQKERRMIVCTAYPQYDWAKQVAAGLEERWELVYLPENGADLHNYQPTAADMIRIADCDVFVYVGGESDAWAKDALKEAPDRDRQIINMMELLADEICREEVVEGMMESGHTHEEETAYSHEEAEYDEHVWLSLRNAEAVVEALAAALGRADEEMAEVYRQNAERYIRMLDALDAEYQTCVETAERKTLLFADRFPFRYLTKEYGLDYYAAFPGCSAETDADFETIVFLSDQVGGLSLPVVLITEHSDPGLAAVIIETAAGQQNPQSTAQKAQTEAKTPDLQPERFRKEEALREPEILVMNSLQSVSQKDIAKGVSYLTAMQDNLAVLERALH